MQESFDFWKFMAGIGVFLWGMHQLEQALREMAGKTFKDLLQRFTNKPWKGIAVGTAITGILQSSSLVTLMVLAFLGGGMISLGNSLGVVLGANLGTTFTAWIVATLGFKISMSDFAFPFLALGTLTYLFVESRPILRSIGGFLVGFGLLFLGLDFMKTAIEAVAEQIDLSSYISYGLWPFLVIGIVCTALIQSSTAMIVIVLSALNANVVTIQHALAIVIGANIGTTSTLVMGAVGGTADKKRLALANVIFKSVAGLITFFFIEQMIDFTGGFFRVGDPVMELALLNTLINVFGIAIFYPFLGSMEYWLYRKFIADEPAGVSSFIKNVSTEVPSVAILAMEKEIEEAFGKTVKFIKKLMLKSQIPNESLSVWQKIMYQPKDLMAEYNKLKQLEDELTVYGITLQEQNLTFEEAERLTHMMHALREMIYGAKDFKDIIHNIQQMEKSQEPFVAQILSELRALTSSCARSVKGASEQAELVSALNGMNEGYEKMILNLYDRLKYSKTDVPISTLTNVIKQTVSGLTHLGNAVVHWKADVSSFTKGEALLG